MTARDRLREVRAEAQRVLLLAESEGCKWAENVADAVALLEAAESEAQCEDPPEQPPTAGKSPGQA
jgi:hypothetical protein